MITTPGMDKRSLAQQKGDKRVLHILTNPHDKWASLLPLLLRLLAPPLLPADWHDSPVPPARLVLLLERFDPPSSGTAIHPRPHIPLPLRLVRVGFGFMRGSRGLQLGGNHGVERVVWRGRSTVGGGGGEFGEVVESGGEGGGREKLGEEESLCMSVDGERKGQEEGFVVGQDMRE